MKTLLMLAFLIPLFCSAQLKGLVISGNVQGEDGKPLANAIVLIAGSATGIMTDENGHYILSIPESMLGKIITLQFQYLGYSTNSKKINTHKLPKEMNMKLKEHVISCY